MGLRAERRTQLSLQVRICGADRQQRPFTRLANAVDVSASGARFAGVYADLAPGTEIKVQCGNHEAPFRVIWVGEKGTPRVGEIGVASLDPAIQLWAVNNMDPWKDVYTPTASTEKPERRAIRRYKCEMPVRVTPKGSTLGTYGSCTDISRRGCYIESWTPLDVGAELHLQFQPGENITFAAKATVRSKDPAFGMGLHFTEVDSPELLSRVVAHFASKALMTRAAEARKEHRFAAAKRDLHEAVEVCRSHGARLGLARSLVSLGQVQRDQRKPEEALSNYEEAAALYRAEREDLRLAHTIRHVADICRELKRNEEAEPLYEEALAIYRAHDATPLLELANAIRGMALLKSDTGNNADARMLWEEARYLYGSAGVEAGVAESARRLAVLAAGGLS
jgi:hypothetical protein